MKESYINRDVGRVFVILPVVALFSTPIAYAQNNDTNLKTTSNKTSYTFVVKTIRIEGNDSTESEVILQKAGIEPGMTLAPEDLDRVAQDIMNLQLFSEVNVDRILEEDGVVRIRVDERWTLIPLPFVGASAAGIAAGGFLMEQNLLGWNKRLGAGGIYSPQGSQFFILYQDPSLFQTRGLAEIQAAYFFGPRQRFDVNDLQEEFEDQVSQIALWSGYKVTPHLDLLFGGFGNFGSTTVIEDQPTPPQRGTVTGLGFKLRYDHQDYTLFIKEGIRTELTVQGGLKGAGADRHYLAIDTTFTAGTLLSWQHALSLTGRISVRHGDPYLDLLILGGRPGTRGFRDRGLWANRTANVTLEYAMPLFRFGGTWAAVMFADAGLLYWNEQRQTYAHPGVGLRFFVADLAIPALGIDVTYNPSAQLVFPSVSLGLGF